MTLTRCLQVVVTTLVSTELESRRDQVQGELRDLESGGGIWWVMFGRDLGSSSIEPGALKRLGHLNTQGHFALYANGVSPQVVRLRRVTLALMTGWWGQAPHASPCST